jgi:TRAP-type C4-dicarboxylate transport system substrate-binding protein
MYEPILMAKSSFEKLNPEQQAELMKAAAEAEKYAYAASKEADTKLVEAYKKAGVKVVEMSPEQAAMWRKIADTSSYKAFAENVEGGQELLELALSVE